MRKLQTLAAAAAFLALTSYGAAAADFAGTWKVQDSDGKAFDIMLKDDGSAAATRAGEGMKGTWKTEGDTATITWDTGWVTRISKDGEGFKKTAFKKGADMTAEPTNSSPAEKAK